MKTWKPIVLFLISTLQLSFALGASTKSLEYELKKGEVFYYHISTVDTTETDGDHIINQWWSFKVTGKSRSGYQITSTIEKEEQRIKHRYSNSWNHIYDPNRSIFANVQHPIHFTISKKGEISELNLSSLLKEDETVYKENNSPFYLYLEQQNKQNELRNKITKKLNLLFPSFANSNEVEWQTENRNQLQGAVLVHKTIKNTTQTTTITISSLKNKETQKKEPRFNAICEFNNQSGLLNTQRATSEYWENYSNVIEIIEVKKIDTIPTTRNIELLLTAEQSKNPEQLYVVLENNEIGIAKSIGIPTNLHYKVTPAGKNRFVVEVPLLGLQQATVCQLSSGESKSLGSEWVFPSQTDGIVIDLRQPKEQAKNHSLEEKLLEKFHNNLDLISPKEEDKLFVKQCLSKKKNPYIEAKSPFFKWLKELSLKSATQIEKERKNYVKEQRALLSQYKEKLSIESYSILESKMQLLSFTKTTTRALTKRKGVPLGEKIEDESKLDLIKEMKEFTSVEWPRNIFSFSFFHNNDDYLHTTNNRGRTTTMMYYSVKAIAPTDAQYQLQYALVSSLISIQGGLAPNYPLLKEFSETFPNSEYTKLLNSYNNSLLQNKKTNLLREERYSLSGLAPNFSLKNAEGKSTQLSDYKGKWILVNFVFAGLESDTQNLKVLEEEKKRLKNDNFEHIIVFLDAGGPKQVAKFLNQHPLDANILYDRGNKNETVQEYIRFGKYTCLIDPEGFIQYNGEVKSDSEIPSSIINYLNSRVSTEKAQVSLELVLLWTGGILLLLLVLGGGYAWWSRRKQKYEIEKRERLELEMNAVRSQLNPHFIYNTLGSIQHLVNKQENKKANLFLANFAKLMRTVLNQSDMRCIPLASEMETIETYLSLEALRYEFNYKIEVVESIDQEIVEIPTMILQPFVENAVIHGVAGMYQEGEITVNISIKENKILRICITDNGNGTASSAKSKGNGKGISLTEKRCEMLQKVFGQEIRFSSRDRANTKPDRKGTEVEILIELEDM